MKFLFVLVAVVAVAVAEVAVQGNDEILEPITFDIGQRVDGDKLLDMYYSEVDATEGREALSVTINWSYTNINFIRIYAYADNAAYVYSGLPADTGSITVTSTDVERLEVSAYLYGTQEEEYVPSAN